MQKRRLGPRGPEVSAIGLGCMGTTSYDPVPDRQEMVSLLCSAIELGVTFFDTARRTDRSRTKSPWARRSLRSASTW